MDFNISMTRDNTKSYPLHKHPYCEIMIYFEGSGALRTENGDIPFNDSTAVIVPKDILHGSSSRDGFKNISIAGDFENLLFFEAPVSIKYSKDSIILAKLIYENKYSDINYLSSLVSTFIVSLMRSFKTSNQTDEIISIIINDITNNALDINFNVTALLNESGYSEDYIRDKFKTATGKTPVEFVNNLRIEHACRLLQIYGKRISVAELSEKCGFVNTAYFSRKFKEITAKSPRDYAISVK